MGFHGAKFPLPFGPAQGQEGMRKNIELVKKWREAVGEDYPLMIDCYMSLTVPYTIELARRCEPYNVKWIEETLPPDEYEGYARIKEKVSSTLLTTGEHEYTRWGFRTLLEKKCCDVLQPDITCKLGLLYARYKLFFISRRSHHLATLFAFNARVRRHDGSTANCSPGQRV